MVRGANAQEVHHRSHHRACQRWALTQTQTRNSAFMQHAHLEQQHWIRRAWRGRGPAIPDRVCVSRSAAPLCSCAILRVVYDVRKQRSARRCCPSCTCAVTWCTGHGQNRTEILINGIRQTSYVALLTTRQKGGESDLVCKTQPVCLQLSSRLAQVADSGRNMTLWCPLLRRSSGTRMRASYLFGGKAINGCNCDDEAARRAHRLRAALHVAA